LVNSVEETARVRRRAASSWTGRKARSSSAAGFFGATLSVISTVPDFSAGGSQGAGLKARGSGTELSSFTSRRAWKPFCQPPTERATALRSSADSFRPATHSACSIISGVTAGAFSAWAATARWKTADPTPAAASASSKPRRVGSAGVGLFMSAFLRGLNEAGRRGGQTSTR
jgi:hypothetical protein